MTKNDIEICYSFFGDKMKKLYFAILIMFIVVVLLSLFYLRNNVMISESSKISYVEDNDIIGSIKIDSIKLSNLLLQGLDNKYYLNHNYLKEIDDNGEIYLDYRGDLSNNKHAIIYSNMQNIYNYNNIKENDKIEIFYLYKLICYKVINTNKNDNLELRIINKKDVRRIYAKKVKC